MANWGYAIAQGIGAGAQSASGMLDAKMKEDADVRAADRKLAIEERLMASREAMEARADERRNKYNTDSQERGFTHSKEMQAGSQEFSAAESEKNREQQGMLAANAQEFQRGEGAANRANAATLQREAQANNWKIDSEGYYVKPDGSRVLNPETKTPLKAPANKVDGKPDWQKKEELDSINKQIEQATRDSNDPVKAKGAKATLENLKREKAKLMGGSPGGAAFNASTQSADDYIAGLIGGKR